MALVALPSSEIWAAAGGQVAQIQFIHLLALGPCFVTINESFLNRAKPFPLVFSHPSGTVDLPHSPRKVWVWSDLQDHLVPSPCHGWGWPGCSMPLLGCHQRKQATQTHKVLWAFQHCPPHPQHMSRSSASPKTMTCSWALQGDTSSTLKAGWCACVLSWGGPEPFLTMGCCQCFHQVETRAGSTCVLQEREGGSFPG